MKSAVLLITLVATGIPALAAELTTAKTPASAQPPSAVSTAPAATATKVDILEVQPMVLTPSFCGQADVLRLLATTPMGIQWQAQQQEAMRQAIAQSRAAAQQTTQAKTAIPSTPSPAAAPAAETTSASQK